MRRRYIVAYDVSDQQRLAKTYKVMNGYGDPIQYSVFACDLSDKELVFLKEDLGEILNWDEDRILLVDTGAANGTNDRVKTIGVPLQKRDVVTVI